MRVYSASVAALVALGLGCANDHSPASSQRAQKRDAGAGNKHATDAGLDATADGSLASLCTNAQPQSLGVASASFGTRPLRLEPTFELSGPGADSLVEAKTQGLIALVPYRRGVNALAWNGFWDLEFGAEPRWIETGTIVQGGLAGDIDGDGDDDLVIFSSMVEGSDGLITHVLAWERTATGLVQRSEIRRSPPVVGMPFAFSDIDADGDLDILTYENGAPIGYINDGAFVFARQVLGEGLAAGGARTTPLPAGEMPVGAVAITMADRDHDGVEDMLVVLFASASEFRFLVLPGDGHGGFKPAVVTTMQETTADGLGFADVTGDGIDDVITQQFQTKSRVHLTASLDATSFAPVVNIEPGGKGIQFADADGDGTLDIITILDDRPTALAGRTDGSFETLDLGIQLNAKLLDYTTARAAEGDPQRLHILYQCVPPTTMP